MSLVFRKRNEHGIPSLESVSEMLEYVSDTGKFIWKVSHGNGVASGVEAGHICPRSGYLFLRINRRLYRASRLAWLFSHGHWPEREVEYINGNRLDNRISNLALRTEMPGRRVSKKPGRDGKAPILTADYVRDRLIYNMDTGEFRWRHGAGKHGHIPAGSIAGSLDNQGYRRISLYDYPFSAARLAYLYVVGAWPAWELDHINNDRDDNRWFNLRLCTPSQNKQNRRIGKNNTTGFKGVFVDKRRPGIFRAVIEANGKRHYLGGFTSPEEAATARAVAAAQLHGRFANDG